jgi:hypothetical protein
MTTPRDHDNRIAGAMVPIDEVQPHLACGWRLVPDEQPIGGRLFLQRPAAQEEERAA